MPHKRRPRVVLDSVVLVSVFLTEEGLAAELFAECVEKAELCTAEEILQETRRVLLEKDHIRSKYAYHDREVERFIELVREKCTVASELPPLHVIERDPKDDMIIACAVAAQADYVVSRDLDLLDLGEYRGIQIVSPEDFVQYLRDDGDH
jgi:putative PIN family toxin of toxin-antitoxin system